MSVKASSTDVASAGIGVLYAIGDIHGETERLKRLYEMVRARHAQEYPGQACRIVFLGDYVDRGADSCGVIAFLMARQKEAPGEIVCLRGNHEQMMLDALDDGHGLTHENWLLNGGNETMLSYARRGFDEVPMAHRAWLRSLPDIHVEERLKLVCVHAGIDPAGYPDCRPGVRLWTRAQTFFDTGLWQNPALDGWTVIHGHTPTDDHFPFMDDIPPRRINIDTGAVYGGRLTAACITPDNPPRFIHA